MATKKKATRKKVAKKKAAKKPTAKRQEATRARRAAIQETIAEQPNRRAAIRALMGEINEPDHKVIVFADEAPNTYMLRRPFGVMQLDIDTGGGPAAGGLTVLTGPDNAGKTYLMFLLMAMHQRLYGPDAAVFFAASEGGFDFDAARTFGVRVAYPDVMIDEWEQNRRLLQKPPFTKEELAWMKDEVGTISIIQGITGEEVMDTVLDCIRSGLFHIGFVDSISTLRPEADADKTLSDEDKRAARASLETRFMKHYTPMTNTLDGRNFTTLVCSQQVRANQDRASAPGYMQARMKKWQATGAWAIRHGKLLDLCVSNGEKIHRQIKNVKYIVGKQMKWETLKGKAGTHDNIYGEAAFLYPPHFGNGVNLIDSVIMTGLKHGVIYETASGRVHMNTAVGSPIFIAPDMKMLPKLMEADFEFELGIRREILASRGINCLYQSS